MSKNPLINALGAALYIAGVVSFMFYGISEHSPAFETMLGPMLMLSLFVLSAATMGYIFLYQPIVLYFDGEKARAVKLFLHTIGCFAGITLVILLVVLLLPFQPAGL